MVGRNHYTFPAGRLDLGRKPNINIHTEKIYNNYGSGFSGMPYGGFYGGMYGGGYNYGYGAYDTGLTKGEKWMLALGGIASLGGAVLSAFTGGSQKVDASSSDTAEVKSKSQSTPLTREDVAQITKETVEATMSEIQKKENAEIAERKEAAKLQQEGITKNDDGTYSATVKDVFGQNQTISGSLAEVRSQKTEHENKVKEQKEFCQANNIEIKQDGTFTTTINGPDGKEEIITGTTPEGVKQEADDKTKLLNGGNEDLLA